METGKLTDNSPSVKGEKLTAVGFFACDRRCDRKNTFPDGSLSSQDTPRVCAGKMYH